MKRITRRLLLIGAAAAGLSGLGFGVASLMEVPASAAGTTPSRVVAATAAATSAASSTPAKSCPNHSAAGSSTS